MSQPVTGTAPGTASTKMVRLPLFTDGRCNVCGHLKGDHEPLARGVYTCDEDGCDEDLRGYCRASRLTTT